MLKIGTELKEEIKKIINHENSVGEFILWQGNRLITADGSFQFLGIYYNWKTYLLNRYPLKDGYERSYKILLEYTDNKTSGSIYIRFRNNSASFSREILFPFTWGGIDDGIRRAEIMNFSDDIVNNLNGHMNIHTTPDYETGGQYRLYRLALLVYDKPI